MVTDSLLPLLGRCTYLTTAPRALSCRSPDLTRNRSHRYCIGQRPRTRTAALPPLDTSRTIQMRIGERPPNLIASSATPLQAEGQGDCLDDYRALLTRTLTHHRGPSLAECGCGRVTTSNVVQRWHSTMRIGLRRVCSWSCEFDSRHPLHHFGPRQQGYRRSVGRPTLAVLGTRTTHGPHLTRAAPDPKINSSGSLAGLARWLHAGSSSPRTRWC
jgi:hypothetical protein